MRVLLQWSLKSPTDWVETDSALWTTLPKRPVPQETGGRDDLLGYVARLCCQGVEFVGYDHYSVEHMSDGACRVTVWKDDPDDLPTDTLGEFYAREWTFYPLVPTEVNLEQSPTVLFIPQSPTEDWKTRARKWLLG